MMFPEASPLISRIASRFPTAFAQPSSPMRWNDTASPHPRAPLRQHCQVRHECCVLRGNDMPCLFAAATIKSRSIGLYHGHIDNANTDTIRLQFFCGTQSPLDNRTHRYDGGCLPISQNAAPSPRIDNPSIQFRLVGSLQTDVDRAVMPIGEKGCLPRLDRRCRRNR